MNRRELFCGISTVIVAAVVEPDIVQAAIPIYSICPQSPYRGGDYADRQ